MQQSETSRKTHVLVFGLSFAQWLQWKDMVKGGLQSAHMGWSFTSRVAFLIDDAIRHIREHEDLELVYLSNNTGRSPKLIQQEAAQIIEALAQHKYKPWVFFSPELDYLKPLCATAGIRVAQGMLEFAIFERWLSQIPKATGVEP